MDSKWVPCQHGRASLQIVLRIEEKVLRYGGWLRTYCVSSTDQRGVVILLCGGWALGACNSRHKDSNSYVGPLTYAISLKGFKQWNAGREI